MQVALKWQYGGAAVLLVGAFAVFAATHAQPGASAASSRQQQSQRSAASAAGASGHTQAVRTPTVKPVAARTSTPTNTITAMTLGSSVAMGWDDKVGGGYLRRGFRAAAAQSGNHYVVVSRAQAGDWAGKIMPGDYTDWLNTVKPQIVVISWGILDDAHHKTPVSSFRATIHEQIQMALARHMVVFIVTPPVTRASYTQYKTIEPMYLNNEVQVARSFHSPNVYVFDVFDQMKGYIRVHHQTYVPYMADGWHPNTAGHALAGGLLAGDIMRQFGKTPVHFIQ